MLSQDEITTATGMPVVAPRRPQTSTGRGPGTTRTRPGPRPLVSFPVVEETRRRDGTTGATVRRVRVGDESDLSPTREAAQASFARADQHLREHPDWREPAVVEGELVLRNDVSRFLYDGPMMSTWRRDLVPRATALYAMQRPHVDALPDGTPVTEEERPFFLDSLDSIGIRTRARIMRDIVTARAPERGERARWVSLACGAAVPVLDALRERAGEGRGAELHLVDTDPGALAFARRLALEQGLTEGSDFHLLQRDLVTSVVARTSLLDELGEGSAQVVDALGIFEYFRDASCVKLLRNAHRLLAPGGVLVVANMLSDRPELALNQRGIGWPRIYPRSIDELVRLVELAGLPLDRTTVHVPQDGVYAVVEIDVPGPADGPAADGDEELTISLPV